MVHFAIFAADNCRIPRWRRNSVALYFSYKLNSAHVKYYRLLKEFLTYVCAHDLSIFFRSMNTHFRNFCFPLSLSSSLSLHRPPPLYRPALPGLIPGLLDREGRRCRLPDHSHAIYRSRATYRSMWTAAE